MTDWTALERTLAGLPRRAVAAVAARAARRASFAVAAGAPVFGPDAWEWLNATDSAVRVAEAFAAGRAVSGFTLGLASEIARATAAATADATRRTGPSAVVERLELAYAAAAFAADAARAPSPHRAASLAVQGCRSAAEVADGIGRFVEFDVKTVTGMGLLPESAVDPSVSGPLGELWPLGEPDGWGEAWAAFAAVRPTLPRVLEL